MKHLQTFDEFLNEKAYQLTGYAGAKGIPGKVQFAFKKSIESISYDGSPEETVAKINDAWKTWADKEGAKIIKDEVLKIVKDESSIDFLNATLSRVAWSYDTRTVMPTKFNPLIAGDFVINVAFNDDVDAGKFSKKLGGMVNEPLFTGKLTEIIGSNIYTQNNVEIREHFQLLVDNK